MSAESSILVGKLRVIWPRRILGFEELNESEKIIGFVLAGICLLLVSILTRKDCSYRLAELATETTNRLLIHTIYTDR